MEEPTLTAEERHKLLTVLRDMDPKSPQEKRKHVRRKVQLETSIRLVQKRPGVLNVVLVDVSARGVALVMPRQLEAGDRFMLPLRFREGGGWLALCEIRNVTGMSRGRAKVGAKIIDRIDDPAGNSRPPLDWLI
jgi:hypothetical protein